MGSYSGTCEIVESKDELDSIQHFKVTHQPRAYDRERKPPLLKLGRDNSLDDDINKLFEAINLKNSSKGLALSDQGSPGPSRKNALKKPVRVGAPQSPGIGFSEPVSIKQALRGLCISQASEMAAMKRLSKSAASPRISEAGKITSLYRSVVVEAGEFSASMDGDGKERRVEISLMPEDSASTSSEKAPKYFQNPKTSSSNHSVHSSPRFANESTEKEMGITLVKSEIVCVSTKVQSQTLKEQLARKEEHEDNIREPDKNITSPIRSANKVMATKLRRKGRSQSASSSSGATKINKVSKSARNGTRLVKPVIRNKPILKKNLKHDSTSAASAANTSNGINSDLGSSATQLVCQKCQCSLTNAMKEPSKDSLASEPASFKPVVVKANQSSKPREKGEFSQSSKSSLGECSTSTSISEDSNINGSSCGNRPHMSKNLRWEAIQEVKKQHGTLVLRHFNLLKKLGFGDIGTVYLAELIGTNCLFAIKVMDNEYLGRRKKMPRAQTEREILRMLDHPFLPTLYAQFTSDNLSCLVMEYCPGGDLHVLRQKQIGRYFPEQAARFYVAEVLLALEYLHMLGVIYRDLKPENILVREDGHIMLTDFDLSLRCSVNPTLLNPSPLSMEPPKISGPCTGSSCIDPFCIEPSCQVSCFSPRILPAARKTRKQKAALAAHLRSLPQLVAEPTDARSNSFVGTHEYLAPEIIKGEGHGSAVDWWTFGIFLYELLYGKTPFKGSGNEETLANVVFQTLKFPDSPIVSFQARDLIRGLLVKEPENRLGSEKGAAEIKQHPFFDGLNWALIRCAIPPQLPEFCDIGLLNIATEEMGGNYLECTATEEHLEFELF